MTPLSFEKWEGLGNDFIVVDRHDLSIEQAQRLAPLWCDRGFGIGADGILLVETEPPSMVVINADGSRPEMCGNGIRCVAGYIHNRTGDSPDAILSDAGLRTINTHQCKNNLADISVDMGIPSLTPEKAGIHPKYIQNNTELPQLYTSELDTDGYIVSVGNPHWVFLGDEPNDVTIFGPILEQDPRFQNRTNIEWVSPLGDLHYRVDVWERGSGRTLACGTGATAVGFLLHKLHETPIGQPIQITLPGGDLHIQVDSEGHAWMRGPATRVFNGHLSGHLLP